LFLSDHDFTNTTSASEQQLADRLTTFDLITTKSTRNCLAARNRTITFAASATGATGTIGLAH
jgi:hypothetical protein